MHEMSLAEGVLQLVEETAGRESARRVTLIVLEIGRLSAVEPEALAFCFASVAQGGIAREARLEIVDVPGQGWCPDCVASVPMAALYEPCPQCGGHRLQATSGTEMRVKEIEID